MHTEHTAWVLHQQQAAQLAIETERIRRIQERNGLEPAPARVPWWMALRHHLEHWTLPHPRPAVPLH